jgi:hypothetical protein
MIFINNNNNNNNNNNINNNNNNNINNHNNNNNKNNIGGDIYDYISLSRIAPFIYLYWYNNNNNIPYPSEFLSNSAYGIADYQLAYIY